MSQFAAAFSSFFAMLFTLFSAGEKAAKAIENLASVAEAASGEYADDATIQREMRLAERKKAREVQAEQLKLTA